MSFDKETRNLLAKAVAACRRRLIEDVTDQLRGIFGLHPDGTMLPLDKLTHLSADQNSAARRLRDLLDHYTVGAAGNESDRRKAAYERMVLEISFTVLNRLAALRLCEEQGLIIEGVRKGTTSAGFQMFERISGGALGGRYDTYRVYLECLFDELALDLGVLFDRVTPQSAVFPTERCMEDVLAELNRPELTHLWTEDETIGWIYQYFNPPEERKAMREASQAPRNSRELAVRNQFFTPRYVVEFLTDNTLGRIWYEMRRGGTALKEECRYLVRRPNEIFLAPTDKAPADQGNETGLSQEGLLRKQVHIEYRARKDPRDLHVLDPACGSGHFLLYAFDLLERIYEEAWADPESPKSEITGRNLREDFENLDDLRQSAPKLIIEHNLHGIDIDPRAVQIAALALWVRAQKSWKNLGIKAAERPRIAKANIVTAEPMPGEEDMRREFTAGIKPRVLGQLVDIVFEKMKLAGEAGSLLKIEEEIKDAVAEAKKQWLEGPKLEQQLLFPGLADPQPTQQDLRFDFKGVTDKRFWEQAEDRILEALKDYAEVAESGHVIRRQLFAEDAARGFAFIDLCRKRYDVVLMNPPFGESQDIVNILLKRYFHLGRPDAYMCFMLRAAGLLDDKGKAGCITSRTFQNLEFFESLRRNLTSGKMPLQLMVDLAGGVLDGATVETCLSVYDAPTDRESFSKEAIFINVAHVAERDRLLHESIQLIRSGRASEYLFVRSLNWFTHLPGVVLCYSLHDAILRAFLQFTALNPSQAWATEVTKKPSYADVLQGLIPGDIFRFVRLVTELSPDRIADGSWYRLCRGGDFQRFWADEPCVVRWAMNGKEIMQYAADNYGGASRTIKNVDYFGRRGLTYPRISSIGLNVRAMSAGFAFSDAGMAIIPCEEDHLLNLSGLLNSRLADYVASSLHPGRKFEIAHISSIPVPESLVEDKTIPKLAKQSILIAREFVIQEEDSSLFSAPSIIAPKTLKILTDDKRARIRSALEKYASLQKEINRIVNTHYRIGPQAVNEIDILYRNSGHEPETIDDKSGIFNCRRLIEVWPEEIGRIIKARLVDEKDEIMALCSYMVGCIFGRWDVRIALDPSLAPNLPDPFDLLPTCPPGMLVGPEGHPATSNYIVSEEWLRARLGVNALRPEGSVKNLTVPDDCYPLRISWDGILVDDPGFSVGQPHRDDIVRRVHEVFDLLWRDKAHEIEREACEIIGVSDLRDYFRRPAGFFQDHLKRYSKSRRKAPIYWPLSTASGSYTVWFYYHRLTDQTLYAAVNNYVGPKIAETERWIARATDDLKASSGRNATRLTDRLNEVRIFLGELRDLREELLRVAALPFKPDLNDGVIINAAPLHNLFRFRPWAKEAEECWKKLAKGDYDWSNLAYTTWLDRVREVCKTDRSIAIAHGLEDICEVEAQRAKKKGGSGRRNREASR
jgi:hypothetical protein